MSPDERGLRQRGRHCGQKRGIISVARESSDERGLMPSMWAGRSASRLTHEKVRACEPIARLEPAIDGPLRPTCLGSPWGRNSAAGRCAHG